MEGIAEITVELNGIDFDAEVQYEFEEGQEAVTSLAPENCQEGFPDEWRLENLVIIHYGDNMPKAKRVDITGMLNAPDFRKTVVQSVWEFVDVN